MLNTSKDVLWLLLGFSILWLSLWMSWIFYQIGRTMKNVNRTIEGVQGVISSLQQAINAFKGKAGEAAAYLTILVKGGQQLMNMIQKKSRTTKKK